MYTAFSAREVEQLSGPVHLSDEDLLLAKVIRHHYPSFLLTNFSQEQKQKLHGTPSDASSWPENVENVQIFPLAGYTWWFYQYLCNKSTALLQAGALGAQSYNNNNKGNFYSTLLPDRGEAQGTL